MSGPTVEEMMAANKSIGMLMESLRRAVLTLRPRLGGPRGVPRILSLWDPFLSLVNCGFNMKELVFFLFNIQPNLLLVDPLPLLLDNTPFGLYQDLTVTFSHLPYPYGLRQIYNNCSKDLQRTIA